MTDHPELSGRDRLLLALVCVLTSLGLASTAAIDGLVTGPDGAPLVATVWAVGATDSGPVTRTVCDVEGRFTLAAEGTGPFRLRLQAPGFAPATVNDVESDSLVRRQLSTGLSIRGRVLDAISGDGLNDATIWVCDDEVDPFGFDACAHQDLGPSGDFAVQGVPSGPIRLGAATPRHAYAAITLEPAAGSDRFVRIELHHGAAVRGRVVSTAGDPIAGARVGIAKSERPFEVVDTLLPGPALITAPDGTFALPGVPVRARAVYRAVAEGWYGDPLKLMIPAAGAAREFELVVRRPAALQFSLIDADGNPVHPMAHLRHQIKGSSVERAATPTDDGRYRIEDLPPGSHELLLRVEGFKPFDLGTLELRSAATIDLGDLTLHDGLTLRGKLVDREGRAIENGTVELTYADPLPFVDVRSTSQGQVQFVGLPQDVELYVRTKADGYQTDRFVRKLNADLTEEWALTSFGGVSGRVLSTEDQPVTVFSVHLQPEDSSDSGSTRRDFETNDGRFFLGSPQLSGPTRVEIDAAGLASLLIRDVQIVEQRRFDLGDIRLDQGGTLSGRALRPGGSAAAGAAITVIHRTHAGLTADETATTNSEGHFSISGLRPGSLAITAIHPDHAPWSSELVLREGQPIATLEIEFSDGGAVVGIARDRAGDGVADVQITLECPMHPTGRNAVTDSSGNYRVERLADGDCHVAAATPDGISFGNPRVVNVVAGRESHADFDRSKAISVTGLVTVGGEAADRGVVTFQRGAMLNRFDVAAAAVDPATGRYTLELDQPGEYRAQIEAGQAKHTETVQIRADENQEHPFDIPLNWVRGRVLDSSGAPIEGADVSVRYFGDLADLFSRSRGDGQFEIRHLAVGTYTLGATSDGYLPARSDTLEIRGDTRIEGLELVLTPSMAKIRGRVTDPHGNPIAGAWVVAGPSGQPIGIEMATHESTTIDGSFEIDAPTDGAVDLSVFAMGWSPARLRGLSSREREVDVRLTSGGRLIVQVRDSDGKPVEGVVFEIRADPPWLGSDLLALSAAAPISGPTGVATVEHLAPGSYRLTIGAGPGVSATIREDQTTSVTLGAP